jgi:hypothetical protein
MKKLMHFVAVLSKISAAIWHFGGVELKMDKLRELSSPYTINLLTEARTVILGLGALAALLAIWGDLGLPRHLVVIETPAGR